MENVEKINKALDVGLSLLTDVVKTLFCLAKDEILKSIYNKKLCNDISEIISKYSLSDNDKQNFITWAGCDLKRAVKQGFSKKADLKTVIINIRNLLGNKLNELKVGEEDVAPIVDGILAIVLEAYKKENPESYKLYKLDEKSGTLISKTNVIIEELNLITSNYKNIKSVDQYNEWLGETYHKDGFVMSLDYFEVDDKDFLDRFSKLINEFAFFTVVHNDEDEAVGCVLNTLRRINKGKNVHVILNQKTWDSLDNNLSSSILLAAFKSDQIQNIKGCICIYFSPRITNGECIELRKRKIETLEKKLLDGGYPRKNVYKLLKSTNGLYSGIKYHLFNGTVTPYKVDNLDPKMIKALLLIKGFVLEDIDFIADLFNFDKEPFKDKTIEMCNGDNNQLLYEKKRYQKTYYTLTNFEGVWYCSGNYIAKVDFDSFCSSTLTEVIKYIGNSSCCSKYMMESILEMIDFVVCVYHKGWQHIADIFVENLLNQCLSKDNLICELICEFGYMLVDISPETFIDFCEQNISNLKEIFEDKCKKYPFHRGPYKSLIWQIGDAMQYDEGSYVWQSISILIDMMDWNIEDKGTYAQEQITKCLWAGFNYSGLSQDSRLAIFKKIIDEYKEKGWNIAFDATIANSVSVAFSGSLYRPIALDLNKNNKANSELYSGYCLSLKETANLEGLVKMLDEYPLVRLSKQDLLNICDDIKQQLTLLIDFDAFEYELKLRNKVHDIRFFERPYFKEKNDVIEKLIDIFSTIQYKNGLMKYLYCLCSGIDFFPIIDPAPYKEDDINSNEDKVSSLLKFEYKTFIEEGYSLPQLVELYFEYCFYEKINTINIVDNLIAMNNEFDNNVFELFIQKGKSGDAASYFVRTLRNKGNYQELISKIVNDGVKGIVLSYTRQYSVEFFDKLKSESDETRKAFWNSFISKLESKEIVSAAIDSFPEGKLNIKQLSFVLYNALYLEPSVVADECLDNTELLKDTHISYYVELFLNNLSKTELSDELLEKLVRLEYYVCDRQNKKYLNLFLAKHPAAFCEILSYIYSSKKRHLNSDNSVGYYSLYNRLKFCPGESELSSKVPTFNEWYVEFLKVYTDYGFDKDVGSVIGRLLPNSKLNEDGLPLQDSVREYIEKHYNKSLRNSFWAAELNKRGVFTTDGGEGTFALANGYLEISKCFKEKGLTKLSTLYKLIGEDYRNEALNERENSENVT